MNFKAGWYMISPYFLSHYFHEQSKSVCGIMRGDSVLKPVRYPRRCDTCQNGTGKKC